MARKPVKPAAQTLTETVSDEIKATRRKLSDYILDPQNPNKGTPLGSSLLETSVEDFGPARSGVVDSDGVIRAGNHTAEQLMAAGIEDVIEIETTGKEWVVVKRADFDPKTGQRYAVVDNRTNEVGLSWNGAQIRSLMEQGVDLHPFFQDHELSLLTNGTRALDELAATFGEPQAEDFWPTIVLKVSPDTKARFLALFDTLSGTTENEKVLTILSRLE